MPLSQVELFLKKVLQYNLAEGSNNVKQPSKPIVALIVEAGTL